MDHAKGIPQAWRKEGFVGKLDDREILLEKRGVGKWDHDTIV